MEIILSADLEKCLPQPIGFNYDDLKAELTEKLEHYKSMVVTEDSIASGKEDRAKLNKLKAAIDGKRKDVEREYNRPLEEFKAQCKELVGMVDEAAKAIDVQVKGFEEAKKEQKRAAIEKFFRDNVGELVDLLPLERIYNPRWENATYKLIDITREITDAVNKARNDIGIIRKFGGDFQQQMTDTYLRTLDMSAVMAEKNRLEAQADALKALEEAKAGETPARHVEAAPPVEQPGTDEILKDVPVIFYQTTAAFRADMKALCERHGVRYGRVK